MDTKLAATFQEAAFKYQFAKEIRINKKSFLGIK